MGKYNKVDELIHRHTYTYPNCQPLKNRLSVFCERCYTCNIIEKYVFLSV